MIAAGLQWPAALLVLSAAAAWPGVAFANFVLETGVTFSESVDPYTAVSLKTDLEMPGWVSTLAVDGRIEPLSQVGDANLAIDWHGDRPLLTSSHVELDAHYEFVRERDNDIEQYHDLGFDAGIKHDFGAWSLKADAGLFGRLHQDTLRPGFEPLDRRREDFMESDIAVRFTFAEASPLQPFVELAYMRRDYMLQNARTFEGVDVIGGLNIDTAAVKGSVSVFAGWRDRDGAAPAFVAGPMVDLTYAVADETTLALVVTTGLEQQTTGFADIYAFYEAELTLRHALNETVNLSVVTSASLEKRRSGEEKEIETAVKLEWTAKPGVTVFGSLGAVYDKVEGEDSSLAPSASLGVKWSL